MRTKTQKFCSILFAALLFCSSRAWGEDEFEIEKIVVTGSRTAEEIKKSTKNISIIDSEAIEQSNAHTVPDILRSEAGINIRDYSGIGKQVNVDMRGFGETGPSNMLVLIDGRRVNAIDLSNTDWSQISLSQVERIEILRGASSVLYGDNASGGVVNIITKKGKGKPTIKIETKGGSYDMSSTSLESNGSNEKSSYRISAEYLNTDGYRQNNYLYREDIGLELGHWLTQSAETNFNFGYHSDIYGLPGALKANELSNLGRRATTKTDDNARSMDWFACLGLNYDLQNAGKLASDFSIRTREVDSSYYGAFPWKNENHIVTLGFTPKYTLEKMLFEMPNKLILGLDVYHDEDDIRDGAPSGGNDKLEISKTTLGVYIQDQAELNKHLVIKAGLRHELAKYVFDQLAQAQLKEKSELSDTLYNVGLAVPYGQDSSLFLDYSTSFRYPLVDEFFTSFNPLWGVGGLNTSIQKQTGKNIDAGIRHFFTKNINTNLTLFAHFIKNEIYFNPLTFANTNYDRTIHKGVEFNSNFRLNEYLKFFINYTFVSSKFGKGSFKGNKVPGVPEHKYSVGAQIKPTEKLNINLTGNYVGSMYLISDQNNAQIKLKDWITLDVNLNYSISDFEIFLGVNNIFNTYYSEYGVLSSDGVTRSFYPAPGRNVIAGCRYKF